MKLKRVSVYSLDQKKFIRYAAKIKFDKEFWYKRIEMTFYYENCPNILIVKGDTEKTVYILEKTVEKLPDVLNLFIDEMEKKKIKYLNAATKNESIKLLKSKRMEYLFEEKIEKTIHRGYSFVVCAL
jgi:hypothetical protein